MKQTIQIRRVETRTIQLEVAQALSSETLHAMVNGQAIGSPDLGGQIQHELTPWALTRISPTCECAAPQTRSAKRKR